MKLVKTVQSETMQPLNDTAADFVCRALNCGVQITLAKLRYYDQQGGTHDVETEVSPNGDQEIIHDNVLV